jgi:hypothetical protein
MRHLLIGLFLCSFSLSQGQDLEAPNVAKPVLYSSTLLPLSSSTTLPYYSNKPALKSVLLTPKVLLGAPKSAAFFCRIEDKIARSSKVNFKFRLGSVSYVDALEGKGYFEALSYSKATNFRLSRNN